MRARTLRQVSGNGNNVGRDLINGLNQWTNDCLIDATEMNVRQVNNGAHYSSLAV
jgi:hypothetical protein